MTIEHVMRELRSQSACRRTHLPDRECMAETGASEKRSGDWALEDERIKVYPLIMEHEPENLKTDSKAGKRQSNNDGVGP